MLKSYSKIQNVSKNLLISKCRNLQLRFYVKLIFFLFFFSPNRPVTQDEIGKLLQTESGSSLSGLLNLSDKIPSNIDVLAQAQVDPNNMQIGEFNFMPKLSKTKKNFTFLSNFIDLLENISGQLSGMDISEKDSRRVTRSRTKATENSCLETPEVSMEQSKPSSGSKQVNKLNNLNKL